jgi:ATP-binding cassette subfamily F protein 3
MALRLESAERGGDQVIVAEKVSIAVPEVDGSERVLLENFTGRLTRGEVLGFVGPNGAGKSTLLKTLIGERPVKAGDLKTGGSISAAYYRQDLAQVPMGKTLYDVIAELRPTWERRMVQGHLGRFGFSGDEAQRTADTLSGGERARVALAMLMLSKANLLILDEPTNHLDVETIEVLEDALTDYEGTVVLVSHDRAMLRSLATRVWVLHNRHITDFDGTFEEWETASAERAHAARVQSQEEEALQRVREKQRTGRANAPEAKRAQQKEGERDARREQRNAQQALSDAEKRVAELESRVSKLAKQLEDPDLYTRPDGVERSKKIGKELDAARRELDRGLDAWTAATEAVERWSAVKA